MRGEGGYNPMSPERIKKESVGDRFNGAVVKELEKKFEETHNVANEYFTHAFPFDNLTSIVDVGGLVTPNELRRRGVGFKQGSSASWGDTIYFSKDEIQGNYSTYKVGLDSAKKPVWSAIIVPTQEFKRVSRLNKGLTGGHAMTEEGHNSYNNSGSIYNSNEFTLATESSEEASFAVDQARRSTESIAKKLHDKKVAKIEESEMKAIIKIEEEFEDELKVLFSVSEDEVREMSGTISDFSIIDHNRIINSIENNLKEIDQLIDGKEEEYGILEQNIGYKKSSIQHEIGLQKPSLAERVIERFGAKTKRQVKLESLNSQIAELDEVLRVSQEEINQLRLKSEETKQKLEHLKILFKLIVERRNKIRIVKGSYGEEKKGVGEYYKREGDYGSRLERGDGFNKIRERMRKAYGADEVERAAKVNIDHSVILVDIAGAEDALKATENKPDLRSRIVLVDGNELNDLGVKLFPNGVDALGYKRTYRFSPIDILTKSEEGFELLKAAQLGKTGGKSIEGLTSLVDYLSQKQQATAA